MLIIACNSQLGWIGLDCTNIVYECCSQVYSARQAKRDIDAVYSMGLFDDVNIVPAAAEDSTPENPRVHPPETLKSSHGILRGLPILGQSKGGIHEGLQSTISEMPACNSFLDV